MTEKRRVFISHAHADDKLAALLVELLTTGIGIRASEVLCTSLEGLGVPTGQDFLEFLKNKLRDVDVVMMLLTKNYYLSQFCLCELGASWALSQDVIPLLAPSLTLEEVDVVLSHVQVTPIDEAKKLSGMKDELVRLLGIDQPRAAFWETRRDIFLDRLNELLPSMPVPEVVSREEHQRLEERHDETMKELKAAEDKAQRLQQKIDEIKRCKDAEEVAEVMLDGLPEKERYDALVSEVKACLSRLPDSVIYALFKEQRGEKVMLDPIEHAYFHDDAVRASEDGFLVRDEGVVYVDEDDTGINEAQSALSSLLAFFEDEANYDFLDAQSESHEYPINLKNGRYWRAEFGMMYG